MAESDKQNTTPGQGTSIGRVLLVAFVVAGVCSVLVSGSALFLRDLQVENKLNKQRSAVLLAAGISHNEDEVAQVFAQNFQATLVNLADGTFIASDNPEEWSLQSDLLDSDLYTTLPTSEDTPKLRWLEKRSRVYFNCTGDRLSSLVLPIRGYGLWGTLYGYIALDSSLTEVTGLEFYSHKETPGLGGEVENPKWKSQWNGKQLYDDSGDYRLAVIKGFVTNPADAIYEVDGLAGATLTTKGVDNMLRFWLTDKGFGPLLANLEGGGCPDTLTNALGLLEPNTSDNIKAENG